MITEPQQRLVEHTPDGIVISEHDRIVFANPAVARLCGVSSEDELLGRLTFDLFAPEGNAFRRERIACAARRRARHPLRRAARQSRRRHLRRGGRARAPRRPVHRRRQLGQSSRSPCARITERKRAEAALRESEERLTLAFAGAQEGVWDWNLETGAVVYSPRWKQMLGYADDEIEPHVSAWERLLHPDDMARAQTGSTTASAAAAQSTYEGEFRLRHKDGHYVHVLSRGFPVRREPGGPGRAHRRHALRPHRATAGGRRTGAHGAAGAAGLRAGRRAAAHRARDARSVRRAADGAQPRHRLR